jgi:hypothetical protein
LAQGYFMQRAYILDIQPNAYNVQRIQAILAHAGRRMSLFFSPQFDVF